MAKNISEPDEQRGCFQHHRHGRLEVEPLEEGGGVADTNQEKGREEGRQQLVSESSLESDLHLYTFVLVSCTFYYTYLVFKIIIVLPSSR